MQKRGEGVDCGGTEPQKSKGGRSVLAKKQPNSMLKKAAQRCDKIKQSLKPEEPY